MAHRVKPKYAFDAVGRPARIPILVADGKGKSKEVVFQGVDPIDFGRNVPEEIAKHPWLEEVVDEKPAAAAKKPAAKKTEEVAS